jgi:hypothetical protein
MIAAWVCVGHKVLHPAVALAATSLWFLVEIFQPDTWRELWIPIVGDVGKIPCSAQEKAPYLHVLSPQEDVRVTAPHVDELDEYSQMLGEHLDTTVGIMEDRIRRQVAALLRTQVQELTQEMAHTSEKHEAKIEDIRKHVRKTYTDIQKRSGQDLHEKRAETAAEIEALRTDEIGDLFSEPEPEPETER